MSIVQKNVNAANKRPILNYFINRLCKDYD
jgi:hypothetical protein